MAFYKSLLFLFLFVSCSDSQVSNLEVQNTDTVLLVPIVTENTDTMSKDLGDRQLAGRDYSKLIRDAQKKYKSVALDTLLVVGILPQNENEYIILYETSNTDEGMEFFDYLYGLFKSCVENERVFNGFLNMAEYVDGEFAESYFEDIEVLILKYKTSYCKLKKSISKEAARRLSEINVSCK
jgi:hypothetical protein